MPAMSFGIVAGAMTGWSTGWGHFLFDRGKQVYSLRLPYGFPRSAFLGSGPAGAGAGAGGGGGGAI